MVANLCNISKPCQSVTNGDIYEEIGDPYWYPLSALNQDQPSQDNLSPVQTTDIFGSKY